MTEECWHPRIYATYGFNHPGSDANWQHHIKQARRLLSHHIQPLLPVDRASRILDIGCGAGHLVQCLREIGYCDVTGIDVSAAQIAIGHSNGMGANLVHAGAQEFLAADQHSYDVIIAIDVAEHLNRTELLDTLTMCAHHLSPAGSVILRTPNCGVSVGTYIQASDITHCTAFTPSSMAQALITCGFMTPHFHPCGPIPDSIFGIIRCVAWMARKCFIRLAWRIDTGQSAPCPCTPTFITQALISG